MGSIPSVRVVIMVVSSGLLTLTRARRLGRGDDKKRGSAWRHFPSLIQPLHYNLLTSGSPQGNTRCVGTDGYCVPTERCRGAARISGVGTPNPPEAGVQEVSWSSQRRGPPAFRSRLLLRLPHPRPAATAPPVSASVPFARCIASE